MAANAERHTTIPSALPYTPLDKSKKSVRLLEILPESTGEVIKCNLIHVDLDDAPEYVALSYMWDHDRGFETVECDGVVTRVGRNLWDFLVQFRQVDAMAGTRLWIDAICINQNDDSERGHQVMQMRAVYSKAKSVIAWLGEAEGKERRAFEHLTGDWALWSDEVCEFVGILFQKPYWYRVWIIQEVILAQSLEIWCGPHRLNTRSRDILYYVFVATPGKEVLFKRRNWWESNRQKTLAKGFRLGDLLMAFKDSECTEPYDKVYGLLGVASNATDPHFPIIPDYRKPLVEVLINVLQNHGASFQLGDYKWDEEYFISKLQRMLGVSRRDLKNRLLQSYPDLINHSSLLTRRRLLVIALRLFTIGYLDVGISEPFDDRPYCFWNASAKRSDETWYEELEASAYFHKPSDRST